MNHVSMFIWFILHMTLQQKRTHIIWNHIYNFNLKRSVFYIFVCVLIVFCVYSVHCTLYT